MRRPLMKLIEALNDSKVHFEMIHVHQEKTSAIAIGIDRLQLKSINIII
jgi:hypothetical protein